ncbi:MAG TPA: DUF1326 domain-containing protein [Longimicrobiales bacterium]|nr:DUF1326 domain-containing protein [Longimicrobiales bacterium]
MAEWHVSGTVLIGCSCDWGCPCNFNAPPTHGYCEGGWSWLIDEGSDGDIDLGGLAVTVMAKWPGAIHEGNGEAVAFIDEAADAAQRAALSRLVRGELGGPWAVFINTYQLHGPHLAAYHVVLDGHRSQISVGDAVRLELQPIRNAVTGAEAHPEMVLPEGLILKRGSLAASRVFQVSSDISYDHSGRYTAFGRFDYAGTAPEANGASAH